jgi:membrane-associated phospholipid phosphatase
MIAGRVLNSDEPTSFDREVRRLARRPALRGVDTALSPLFPLGLPGSYLLIAHATARWLRGDRRRGGSAIIASAWLGWLTHRGIKLAYRRERPRRSGIKRRFDSFPSGHTTAITAVALTTAYVLRRQRLISDRAASLLGFGLPALMGTYRVVADDHWATDVVCGWMLGSAIALGCTAVAD